LGALNDNLFKNALVALVTFGLVNQTDLSIGTLVNLAAEPFHPGSSTDLENGYVVGIFPEGMITHDSQLNPVKPVIESIVQRTPVPVIRVALEGFWNNCFSRDAGPAMGEPLWLITRLFSRIEVKTGPPILPEELTAANLDTGVRALLQTSP